MSFLPVCNNVFFIFISEASLFVKDLSLLKTLNKMPNILAELILLQPR